MQIYEGYMENDRFFPTGKTVSIKGRHKVVVTVVDEPAQMSATERESRAAWLKRLDEAYNISKDEELPDFPRSEFMREPINLTDEE